MTLPAKRLSLNQIKNTFQYKEGKLYWRIKPSYVVDIGDEAGCNREGYRVVVYRGCAYQASHLVWAMHNGKLPDKQIDHINGDPSDNRIENLREVTRHENLKNKAIQKNNTSGYTGISWYEPRRKWAAYIRDNGKKVHLGYFKDFTQALATRLTAEEHYGYHPNHGRAA